MLQHFLDFRFEVVTRRHQFELAQVKKRLHVLEGFEKVYDALDEMIRIIRKSDGKQDAAAKLMKRFELDEEQVDAILELQLYRLTQLSVDEIINELAEIRKAIAEYEEILASDKKLRGAGLSRSKMLSLRDLARKAVDGTLPTLAEVRRMDD